MTLVQPDGEVIKCFLSGDELFNYYHDAKGYKIIQDPVTGYYTYAVEENNTFVPSQYHVNEVSPEALKLPKSLTDSETTKIDRQRLSGRFPSGSPLNPELIANAPRTGTINNIVVFIRFSGEASYTDPISTYSTMFNSTTAGDNSLRNYYTEVSYNQLTISTSFYPTQTGGTVVSYQDAQPRGYYQPYSATNTIGYDPDIVNPYDTNGLIYREHTLLKNAINAISSQVPASLNLDGDGDGNVDNVCFIVSGSPDGWSSLLWPHMWSLYSQSAYINDKRVWTFNFQLRDYTVSSSAGVGVLAHEMFHSLGAPDLYHYSYDGLTPVRKWDLMEYDLNPPQHMTAYMKKRYGTWIDSIPTITTSGTYTLSPMTSATNNAYRINSPNSTTEYFIVEYRRRTGTFETSLPGEGLIVYRINTSADGDGNRDGPPDEVYIYRPDGTVSSNGSPDSANFGSAVARTHINDSTNPSGFLSSGAAGGLNLSNIGTAGNTISFTATIGSPPPTLTVTASAGAGGSVSPTSLSVVSGATAEFTVTANSGYSTDRTVGGTCPAGGWSGSHYTSGTITSNCTVSFSFSAAMPLGEALDATSLTWTTSGNANWLGETLTTHDGVDAAQSGAILDFQSSHLNTVVTGPASLTFFWKVSSEEDYDYLTFALDGAEQSSISGEVDWQQKTVSIPSGQHTLSWSYTKDDSVGSGQDAGWVDTVVVDSNPTSYSVTASAGAGGSVSPTSLSVVSGATAVLTVTANGGYSTNSAVGGTCPAGSWSGSHYTTGAITSNCTVSFSFSAAMPLGEALDATSLTWTTSGDANWLGETLTTHDGVDAAQSGAIFDDQSSRLNTVVTGPASLTFFWKVSSELNYDYLSFALDGTEHSSISGEVDWQQKTVDIPSGQHTLSWSYTKDESVGVGQDAGWVDAVVVSSNSGSCQPGPVVLSDEDFHGVDLRRSETSLTAGVAVTVHADAAVTFVAPRITLQPGFQVTAGGGFNATAEAVNCAVATSAQPLHSAATPAPTAEEDSSVGLASRPVLITDIDGLADWVRYRLDDYGIDAPRATALLLAADGQWVVLETEQPLLAADTNGVSDIYRLDLLSETLNLLSRTPAGTAGNGPSRYPAADASGDWIVFQSNASDLASGDDNGVTDIFLHDVPQGETTRLTSALNSASEHPALDAAGEDLLYDQRDDNGSRQVVLDDLRGVSSPMLLSLSEDETGVRLDNHHPAISADGRFVAYLEGSADGQTAHCEIHVYDRDTTGYRRETCPEGLAIEPETARPYFSADGSRVEWHQPGNDASLVVPNALQALPTDTLK